MSVRTNVKVSPSLGQVDPIWHSIRAEAEEAAKNDPVLGAFSLCDNYKSADTGRCCDASHCGSVLAMLI